MPPPSSICPGVPRKTLRAAEDCPKPLQRLAWFVARKLCLGGRLAMLTMAVDPTGDFSCGPLLQDMYRALIGLVDKDLVRPEEALRMAIPTVGRSRVDLVAPRGGPGRLAALTIDSVDVISGEDRILSDFQRAGSTRAFGAMMSSVLACAGVPDHRLRPRQWQRRAAGTRIRVAHGSEARSAAPLTASPEKVRIPLAGMCLVKKACDRGPGKLRRATRPAMGTMRLSAGGGYVDLGRT